MALRTLCKIVICLTFIVACAPQSHKIADINKNFSSWTGTFASNYHTDGIIENWILFSDGTMIGRWITKKGSSVIDVEGEYTIEDNKIYFEATGTLVLYNEKEIPAIIYGDGEFKSFSRATGNFKILIGHLDYPNDNGSWNLTRD
ncbi:MAG: hypothetical protein GY710_25460 [Desulfobacteraceae bacterium]|nr:hypothetical protein [Desulfobacteraceae bacterium]